MAQYVFTMHRLGKVVPPKREILKNISLSFFPGAKIGVLGLNGSGKSTLLKIMAGVDTEFEGEARPMPELNIGYLPQEPILDPTKTVREVVEEAVAVIKNAQARLDEVYAAYSDEDADFDKLAAEQAKLEAILQAGDGHNLERQLEVAADALRLPAWDAKVEFLSGGEKRRVALCRLLLSAPDMLLLDEPTNHLYADTAFLAMDLEDRGLKCLARRFVSQYLELTGDYQGLELLNFYKAYRALVRAKVSLFSMPAEASAVQRAATLRQYRNYANLAESYSTIPSRFLTITHGVSAVGKSSVAMRLVESTWVPSRKPVTPFPS